MFGETISSYHCLSAYQFLEKSVMNCLLDFTTVNSQKNNRPLKLPSDYL